MSGSSTGERVVVNLAHESADLYRWIRQPVGVGLGSSLGSAEHAIPSKGQGDKNNRPPPRGAFTVDGLPINPLFREEALFEAETHGRAATTANSGITTRPAKGQIESTTGDPWFPAHITAIEINL